MTVEEQIQKLLAMKDREVDLIRRIAAWPNPNTKPLKAYCFMLDEINKELAAQGGPKTNTAGDLLDTFSDRTRYFVMGGNKRHE